MNTSFCPFLGECSGCCSSNHILQRASSFFQQQWDGTYLCVAGHASGWRTRAKLAVRNQSETLCCGLFRAGSHEVVSIPGCSAHHPSINRAAEAIASLPPECGYVESTGRGSLRYVQAIVDRKSGSVQLSLVLNLRSFESSEVQRWESWARLRFSEDPGLWHSFWINLQPLATNTVFGPQWKHVCGPKFLIENICGLTIPLLPSHFSQANPEMFERLLADLLEIFPRNTRVAELYAGMGVIGSLLAPYSADVRCVERDRLAEEAFLEIKGRSACPDRIHYIVGDATESEEVLAVAQTVIVDPPRKGLTSTLIEALRQNETVRAIFYISCHFPTLERDSIELMKDGLFHISFARSYLFFPGTDQIETLIRFERSG